MSTKRCIKTSQHVTAPTPQDAQSESTERPKISHAIHLAHTSTLTENRRIPTFRFQILKNSQSNCMRYFPTTLQMSAKRCIKTTLQARFSSSDHRVRKYRAPNGVLRHEPNCSICSRAFSTVSKHRAPKGALRHNDALDGVASHEHVRKRRAPNGALRLEIHGVFHSFLHEVRKHRAPKGALKREHPCA